MENLEKEEGKLNIPLFIISFILVTLVVGWGFYDNAGLIETMKAIKSILVDHMSWTLILSINGIVLVLIYLAFSRFGSKRLGKETDKPEINTFSWIALLISCGASAGFCFWPIAEPLWHYFSTPYLAQSGTPEALVTARSISLFHWGLHLWGLFCITGLCIAYPAFRKDRPLTIPGALYGLLGEKYKTSIFGKFAEVCASFATLIGVGATVALALLLISSGVRIIFNIEVTLYVQAGIMAVIVTLYTLAAYTGLHKGIKILGDINAYLCFAWFAYVLFAGPTSYLLDGMVETFGHYVTNIVYMGTFVDASGTANNWHGDWSVFYYMWNIAWAPLVGGFVARISRGRTIKEYILGTLFVPTLVAVFWFGVIGTASQYVALAEGSTLWATVQADASSGIYALVDFFGGGTFFMIIIFALLCTLLLTSADAAAYFMAMLMSRGSLNPSPIQMLFWGVLVGLLGIIFLTFGGINGVQTAGVIAGAPFLFILIAMIISLFKQLIKEEEAEKAAE